MDCIEVEDKEDKMAAISVMEEFQKKAEETNALITNQYKELADQISEQHFVPLEELVNSLNKKINTEKFIETFKTKLFDKISSQFEISWSTLGIGDGLTLLEYSKSQSEKRGDGLKWRPSGKSVEEQVRPILMNALQRKKHFFEKQQKFQAEKLKVIIEAVEESRKYVNDLKVRQAKLLQKVDKDQLQLETTQQQLDVCRNHIMKHLN